MFFNKKLLFVIKTFLYKKNGGVCINDVSYIPNLSLNTITYQTIGPQATLHIN